MSEASHLDDFHCYICFKWPKKATLCRKCSNVCCSVCITQWIQRSNRCPICQEVLKCEDLVNCVWHNEIRRVLDENEEELTELQFSNCSLKSELEQEKKMSIGKEKQIQNIKKEKNDLLLAFDKTERKFQLNKLAADEVTVENLNLKMLVKKYETYPAIKDFIDAENEIIMSKQQITAANKPTLRLEIAKVSFLMMKKSLTMYQHIKNEETVPASVTEEIESLAEKLNDITLNLKIK